MRFGDNLTMVQQLTDREFEVLKELTNGYNQHQIAKNLHMSWSTVRKHTERIRVKLGANSMPQAVSIAYQEGIFEAKNATVL